MADPDLTLGPVLSFRGAGSDGKWRVTALIGIPEGAAVPELVVDGRRCPAPLELLHHEQQKFLRYDLSCPRQVEGRRIEYGWADGSVRWEFTVPAQNGAPRMAYVSCNGFSDPADMRKLVRPANAVWEDLLANHDSKLRRPGYLLDKEQLWHESGIHNRGQQRFHLLLMGGDQIYFDSIWHDIEELGHWVGLAREQQLSFEVSDELAQRIEDYYLGLYARRWLPTSRRPWSDADPNRDAADALARIPTVMMWDDHDIFDGWGSYTCEMQRSPVYQTLFRCARKAFWIFQLQQHPGTLPPLRPLARANVSFKDPQFEPVNWKAVLRDDPLGLPLLPQQPGFSFGFHMGRVSLLVPDLRTERSRTQVLGPRSWDAIQSWLDDLPQDTPDHPGTRCQHLLLMSSVPVAHPKLALTEGLLDIFGHDHVTDSNADDLRDHWSHDDHQGERKRLLATLTRAAEQKKVRVSIVSGDVHVAAWGLVYRRDAPPAQNRSQLHQFTSSAIMNPPLLGVFDRIFLGILNEAASRPQSLDVQLMVEMMLFPGYNRYVMPARNWMALELESEGAGGAAASQLWVSWRCERESDFSNHLHAVQPAS